MRFDLRSIRHLVVHFAAAIATLFVLTTPASAQVSAGQNELGGLVKFDSEPEDDDWSLDTDVFYGRMLTDRWQVGPGWQMYKQGSDNSGSLRAFGAYHFGAPARAFVPYLQVQVGRYYGYDAGNPFFVGAGPGVKAFFAGGGGAINVVALYRRTFEDKAREANNGVSFSIGASVFFK